MGALPWKKPWRLLAGKDKGKVMVPKRIIPCLDFKGGRVVKGVEFTALKDAGDPVKLACFYDRAGADELVLLNIASSGDGTESLERLIGKITRKVTIPLIAGGGIGNLDQMKTLLQAGADKVSIGSAAVANPEFITEASLRFGSRSLVIAIDAGYNKAMAGWEVFIHGGKTPTGCNVLDWAREIEQRGGGEILLTAIDRDGRRDGYDLELTMAVAAAVQIPVIASGGAGTAEDFWQVLTRGRAAAALAASIFHYQVLTIKEVKNFLARRGVEVNLNWEI